MSVVKPAGGLRLYAGVVQMRVDRPGVTDLHNEHWVGWYASETEARGAWVGATMAMDRHKGHSVSYVGLHDITDIAATGFVPIEAAA